MIVIILEKVPASLRGELSRWLLEPKTGVFVGRISALVREKLWQKCIAAIGPDSGGLLIHHANNEQGFKLTTAGNPSRQVVDFEGLQLIRVPHQDPEKARKKMRLGRKNDTPPTQPLPFIRDDVTSPLMNLNPTNKPHPVVPTPSAVPQEEPIEDEDEFLDAPPWWPKQNKNEHPSA